MYIFIRCICILFTNTQYFILIPFVWLVFDWSVCCVSGLSLPPVANTRSAGNCHYVISVSHTPPPLYPHAYRPQLLILVSNWSGISSPHFELAFGRRRARQRKTRAEESASVFSTVMPLNHVCPAIFKGNCMIMTLTIFIYIYIISVVCYETVKFWLWDKKPCHVCFVFLCPPKASVHNSSLIHAVTLTSQQIVHTGVTRNKNTFKKKCVLMTPHKWQKIYACYIVLYYFLRIVLLLWCFNSSKVVKLSQHIVLSTAYIFSSHFSSQECRHTDNNVCLQWYIIPKRLWIHIIL